VRGRRLTGVQSGPQAACTSFRPLSPAPPTEASATAWTGFTTSPPPTLPVATRRRSPTVPSDSPTTEARPAPAEFPPDHRRGEAAAATAAFKTSATGAAAAAAGQVVAAKYRWWAVLAGAGVGAGGPQSGTPLARRRRPSYRRRGRIPSIATTTERLLWWRRKTMRTTFLAGSATGGYRCGWHSVPCRRLRLLNLPPLTFSLLTNTHRQGTTILRHSL
jgi:hypothetical protein